MAQGRPPPLRLCVVKEDCMSILVHNVRVPVSEGDAQAIAKAKKLLHRRDIKGHVVKKAVDSRRKEISFVYTIGFEAGPEEKLLVETLHHKDVVYKQQEPVVWRQGTQKLPTRPVIVGFGPAGMFAGLLLAQQGYRPIIFEGGSRVEERVQKIQTYWQGGILDTRCNVQFGEGGAGTFSDGKLTTRIGDSRCGYVLEQLAHFGAPQDICYLAKPHIGTDRLRDVVRNIRQEILRLGGEIRFDDKMEGLDIREGRLKAIITEQEGRVETGIAVLAIGHSARDTYEMLVQKGFAMEPKPFSVGVRAEHLQKDIDRMVYKDFAGHPHLHPAEYQLSHRMGEECCYSFCMCPGGTVVAAASEMDTICVNGMSEYRRDGRNANSAIVAAVDPRNFDGDSVLRGMYFQRELEQRAWKQAGGAAPIQCLGDFMQGQPTRRLGRVQPSYTGQTCMTDLTKVLPSFAVQVIQQGFAQFGRRMAGFDAEDTLLTGVETRTSAPVRILRDAECLQSPSAAGVYPCGEGAGYAGGIMSAAVDGLRVAEAIMAQYAPMEG